MITEIHPQYSVDDIETVDDVLCKTKFLYDLESGQTDTCDLADLLGMLIKQNFQLQEQIYNLKYELDSHDHKTRSSCYYD